MDAIVTRLWILGQEHGPTDGLDRFLPLLGLDVTPLTLLTLAARSLMLLSQRYILLAVAVLQIYSP